MTLEINGVSHTIPTTVSEITLGQFVDYHNKYGKEFDEKFQTLIDSKEDELEKEFGLYDLMDREALSWFSYFTGHDFFNSTDVDLTALISAYYTMRQELKDSESVAIEFPIVAMIEGEEYTIKDYKLEADSTMTFGELLTGKEVIRQIVKLGNSKWEALLYLCAIYLRKKDEAFSDGLVKTRLSVMRNLSLQDALKVSFFLTSSINTFKKRFLYLEPEEEGEIVHRN